VKADKLAAKESLPEPALPAGLHWNDQDEAFKRRHLARLAWQTPCNPTLPSPAASPVPSLMPGAQPGVQIRRLVSPTALEMSSWTVEFLEAHKRRQRLEINRELERTGNWDYKQGTPEDKYWDECRAC
jgi:hypothetical protein